MKDYTSMSKEELASHLQELKAYIETIEKTFHELKNTSVKMPGEMDTKFHEELKKVKEGIAKIEKLLSE